MFHQFHHLEEISPSASDLIQLIGTALQACYIGWSLRLTWPLSRELFSAHISKSGAWKSSLEAPCAYGGQFNWELHCRVIVLGQFIGKPLMSVSVGLFLGLVRFPRNVYSCLLRRRNKSACQCSGCRMGKERWWSPYLVCRLTLLNTLFPMGHLCPSLQLMSPSPANLFYPFLVEVSSVFCWGGGETVTH